MPSWLPSIPYPAPRNDGYWAPITSTLDWCEENYYATTYSAEIVNTLTNLLFFYLAFQGMYNCYAHGHDRIFFLAFVGYLLVGSGSFAFHATLKYPMQLVDELSMIYTTCLMLWATFEHKRPQPVPALLALLCVAIAAAVTLYYHYLQDPSFHQNAYALLTALVLTRSMYVMEVNLRPYYRRRREERARGAKVAAAAAAAARKDGDGDGNGDGDEEARRVDERDAAILKSMWTMVAVGLSVFLGGFGIWQLDNIYCARLRRWRHEVGLPWGIVLEGHGWWHLMTGLGAYTYIVWGIWLRHCLNGRQDEFELIWPRLLTSIPRVERRLLGSGEQERMKKTELLRRDDVNGSAKKRS